MQIHIPWFLGVSLRTISLIFLIAFTSTNCSIMYKKLETVSDVNIEKYTGKWYEIARFPHRFEKDLSCVTAEYSLKENGKIKVLNKGVKPDGSLTQIEGTATVPNKKKPGRLKVTFFWPFGAKYYILDLDKDYNYALVGHPSRNYLWILSREPNLEKADYQKLVDKAYELGFDTSKIEKVKQDCE